MYGRANDSVVGKVVLKPIEYMGLGIWEIDELLEKERKDEFHVKCVIFQTDTDLQVGMKRME